MFKIGYVMGDYKWRQLHANTLNLDLYLEYHFNYYSKSTNYTLCKIAKNYKPLALEFARKHAQAIHQEFDIPLYNIDGEEEAKDGVLTFKKTGRGNFNISLVDCPAVIIEPLFLSNPTHVELLVKEDGINRLSGVLTKTIREILPNGGNVGFSVGHKYQRSSPMDRGALAYGRNELSEADLADTILTVSRIHLAYGLEVDTSTPLQHTQIFDTASE